MLCHLHRCPTSVQRPQDGRGFWPVVALGPSSSSSGQLPLAAAGKGSSKGKTKKGKGKGKGFRKNVYRYSKPPPKQADPHGRARAALGPSCMRCGSTQHRAAQCNQGQPAAKTTIANPNKKQAVEGVATKDDYMEEGMVIFEDASGAQRTECAMMDPGASSFLMGFGPFLRHVEHLGCLGFPTDEIVFKKANRTFHFGGDHQSISQWTVHLPVFLNHEYGWIQAFLLKGEPPMLLGRPIAKALGMMVDFSEERIKFKNGEWQPATLGKYANYFIPLTEHL